MIRRYIAWLNWDATDAESAASSAERRGSNGQGCRTRHSQTGERFIRRLIAERRID
jgi:hypothetical protein